MAGTAQARTQLAAIPLQTAQDGYHPTYTIDRFTEQGIGKISLGDQADTDAAVAAAHAALKSWSASSKEDRIALLERILETYEARSDDIAHAISLEMGAPIDMAKTQQVDSRTWHIRNFIRTLQNFEFNRMLGSHAPNDRILYEPIGVCGLITPWNWPMNQVALKVIPALAAGCTMVLKPSEIAPISGMIFAEIMHDAGMPPRIFNLLDGEGGAWGLEDFLEVNAISGWVDT